MELNMFKIEGDRLVDTSNISKEYDGVINPDVVNYLLKLFDLTLVYNKNNNTYNLKNNKTGKLYNGTKVDGNFKFKTNNAIVELNDHYININFDCKSIYFSSYPGSNKIEFKMYDKNKNFSLNIELSYSDLKNNSLYGENYKKISTLNFYGGYEPKKGMAYDKIYQYTKFSIVCEPDRIIFSGPKENKVLSYELIEENVKFMIDSFNISLSGYKNIKLKNKDLNLINFFMYDFIKMFLNINNSILLNNKDYLVKLFSDRKVKCKKDSSNKVKEIKKEFDIEFKKLLENYQSNLKKVESSYGKNAEEIERIISFLSNNKSKKGI